MKHGIYISKPLTILSKDELYSIHNASLEVLEKTGIRISHNGLLKELQEHGAEVDYNTQIAKIPEHLISESLKKTSNEIVLCGRNPKYDLILKKGYCYATTTGGAIYIVDYNGHYRKANSKDTANLTRLADGLNNININEGLADPQEIPHEIRDIVASAIILKNTEKHCRYAVMSPQGAKALIEMAITIMGSKEELERRPIISGAGYVAPPLHFDKDIGIPILLEYVKHSLPVYVGSEPLSGTTSPVTLAGTLVQNNAEALAGIVIIKLINPKTPIIYGGNPNTLDMRTGVAVQASPEIALMLACVIEMANFYNLPSWIYSGMTNSKIPDQQVGYEKALISLLPLLAGPNIYFAAGNLCGALATSYEQLVIDDELIDFMRRIIEGVKINDITLAVDVINRVGPAGHYLNQKHTKEWFRKEWWIPRIGERIGLDAWLKGSKKNIVYRAKEIAEEILEKHYPEPLPSDIQKEIDKIVKSYIRMLS
jgi:trimethylamine--corrinoid protein Co-methyltransferase